MKTIVTTAAAALFAANVGAVEIYDRFGTGNGDLVTERPTAEDFAGVQPSIGDGIDRYHGLAEGNGDLFGARYAGPTDSGEGPDIYRGLDGNPDLRF
jgi:hypothetical protein